MNQFIKDKFALNHSAQITVSEDKEETADLALSAAPESAIVITGQVTSNGQPFHGAVVKLFTDPNKNTPYQHTLTDEKGNYSFVSVKPGTYYAAAVAEGFVLSPQVEVEVAEGGISIVNFMITPAPSLLLGSISGTSGILVEWVLTGATKPRSCTSCLRLIMNRALSFVTILFLL